MQSEWPRLIQGAAAGLELQSHRPGLSALGCAASFQTQPPVLCPGCSFFLFCTFPSLTRNQCLFSFCLYQ